MWTAPQTLGDSIVADDGAQIEVRGDGRVVATDSTADATVKLGRFGTRRFLNATAVPFDAVIARAVNGFQTVDIGGGQADAHAATEVRVFVAATPTTPTGTLIATMSLSADMWLRRGAALAVVGDGTSSPQILRAKSDAGFTTDWYYAGGVIAANRRWGWQHVPGNNLVLSRRDAGGVAVDTPITYEFSTGNVLVANRLVLGAVHLIAGTGDPNGVVAAPVGSTFQRSDGGAGSTFYVKEGGGAGNTGWAAK